MNAHRSFAWLTTALALAATSAFAQGAFREVDLASDQAGRARSTNTDLVNPWGLATGGSGVFWTANNGTGTSSLYQPNGTKVPLTVIVPHGAITGVVATDPAQAAFSIPGGGANSRAAFIFVSETGRISAWNRQLDSTFAVVVDSGGGNYKGAAVAYGASGPRLYVANFSGAGEVEVYDANFAEVNLGGAFTDPNLPAGYAPFNVAVINGQVVVAYAQVGAGGDENAGAGLGLVDVFDTNGGFVRRLVSPGGALNAPWGLSLAPASWGDFAGDLLVGNFGDGTIHAYSMATGAPDGALRDSTGAVIAIDGLWAIATARSVSGAPFTDWLYFTAGPDDETHGLFGFLTPSAAAGPVVACSQGGRLSDDFLESQCRMLTGDTWRCGRTTGSPDSLSGLFACIRDSSAFFGVSGCMTPACNLLFTKGHATAQQRAVRSLLILELNHCAGLVCDSTTLACGDLFDGLGGHGKGKGKGNGNGNGKGKGKGHDGDDNKGKGKGHGAGHGYAAMYGTIANAIDCGCEPDSMPTFTLGDVIDVLDHALCSRMDADTLEFLARLGECAVQSLGTQRTGGSGGGGYVATGGGSQPIVTVAPFGNNPMRLSSGPAMGFVVNAPQSTPVRLAIYDVGGRLVRELMRDATVTGSTIVRWDGLDANGMRVSQGTYFYRATAGTGVASGRMIVLH